MDPAVRLYGPCGPVETEKKEERMNQSMLAEQKTDACTETTETGGLERQSRDMHMRLLRFLLRELQSCRTDAEREALFPAMLEARMRLKDG